jgi:hypothetical protein
MNCLASKCPFMGPSGHHYERNKKHSHHPYHILALSQPAGLIIFISGKILMCEISFTALVANKNHNY